MAVSVNLAKLNRASIRTNANEKTSAPKLAAKTTNVTAAASANVSRTGSANNIRFQATQALGSSQRMHTFSRNAAYSDSPFVSGFRNPTPNDFVMRNVGLNIGASIENGFSLTPRGQRREVGRYFDMLAKLNQHQCQGNTGADKVSTMAMLNQLGQIAGTVAKEIKGANAAAETKKQQSLQQLGSDVAKTISGISSADSSADLVETRAEIKGHIEENKGEQNKLSAEIKADTDLRKEAQGQLDTVSGNISSLTREISALRISGMKDGVDNSAQIKEKEAQLKELKQQQQELETTVKNLDKSISENEQKLETKKEQAETLEAQHNKAQAKEDKLEQKETKELNSISNKLASLKEKIEKEDDNNKKQELIAKYNAHVSNYNNILDGANADVTSQFQAIENYAG